MTYTVLFVCAGNVGRSPLAEVMARRLLAESLGVEDGEVEARGIRVLSAGTEAPAGILTSRRGVGLAEEIGITMAPRPAQRLTKEMASGADVIFGMDAGHVEHLSRWGFGDKTELLDPRSGEIPDPRRRDMAFFRDVRDQIAVALSERVPRIITAARPN